MSNSILDKARVVPAIFAALLSSKGSKVVGVSAVALILASLSSAQCQVQESRSGLRGPGQWRYATQLALLSDLGFNGNRPGFSLASGSLARQDSMHAADTLRSGRRSVVLAVAGETVLGAFAGTAFSFPCAYVAVQIGRAKGLGELGPGLLGMYAGFVLGSSLGVYAGGDGEARSISAPATILSGLIGAGIGIGVYTLSDKKGALNLAPLVFPLVTSIIYVEILGTPAS